MSRRLAALLLACWGAVACGPSESGGEASVERVVLRPGESLFDRLDEAEVVAWADSNLPADLAPLAARDTVRMALPPIPREAWGEVRNVPAEWRPLLETVGPARFWRTALPGPAPGPDEDPRVEVLVQGQAPEAWVPGSGPPPGTVAWWDGDAGALLSLSVESPVMVSVVRDVPGDAAWAGLEGAQRPDGPRVARAVFGETTRPSLACPAPATLRWTFDALEVERLELVVGRLDRGWRVADGVVSAARGLGDGVRFAVEIREAADTAASTAAGAGADTASDTKAGSDPSPASGSSSQYADAPAFARLWEGDLLPDAVSAAATVDLSAWTGRPVQLQLVTETRADPVGDYALWADLHARGGAARAPARPHVVLIDIDTLRADRLGAYGSSEVLTPRLDRWAAQATVFADALAPSSWTLPSTVSMFTGLAVHQHGITRGTMALGEQVPTLATRLRAAGYETRGVAAGGYLRPTFGLDAGFDVYETVDPKSMDWAPVLDELRARDSERPLFLMLHTYFVHAPYAHDPVFADGYAGPFAGQDVDYANVLDPHRYGELELDEDDRRYVEAMYNALVARMDAHAGDFLDGLSDALGGQPVLVVLTSDHGEAFLEHDLLGHGEALWNELLAVPLIVAFPDGRAGVDRRAASLVDIVPTILDVAGLERPEGLAGQSLAQPAPAGPPRVRVSALDDGQRATASDGLTLFEQEAAEPAVAPRLFETFRDAGQTRDVSGERGDAVLDMQRRRRWYEAHFPAVQAAGDALGGLSEADRAQLEALGYLGADEGG